MTTDDRSARRRPATLHPELGRFWIRRSFPTWPGPDTPWMDLASGTLGRSAVAGLPDIEEGAAEGFLTYLPPVSGALETERRRLAERLVAWGTPVLLQVGPGESTTDDGAHRVVDLLESLLADDIAALGTVPAGAVAAWPLIAGLTDREEQWQAGCDRLAGAGARVVQPLALMIDPRERRQLLLRGGDDAAFDRLFHGATVDERAFARVAASYGLEPFWLRPAAGRERVAQSQQVAELLAFGGELSLRLGREVQGQELYRAARWAEEADLDMRALVEEGNTQIVPWLRGPALDIVTEWGRSSALGVLGGWLREYLGGEEGKLEDGDD